MGKSAIMAADVAALLRSRAALLWVVTREEARVEQYLVEAARSAGCIPYTWDVAQGLMDFALNDDGVLVGKAVGDPDRDNCKGPDDAFNFIRDRAIGGGRRAGAPERSVWIMRDMTPWLRPPIGIATQRQLRNLVRLLPSIGLERAQTIVVLTPVADVPEELAADTKVVEWPLPDRGEIGDILNDSLEPLRPAIRKTALAEGAKDKAVDAAVGLTGEEAQSCFAKSLVQFKCIDPAAVAREKKRVVTRGGLEWHDPLEGGLDAVGGLAYLKDWLMQRALAYTPEAREYKLPAPKGAMLVGVQGCGKSMTAKAISTAWGVPLLKMDLGALKSKFVGESEANIRKAFGVIEAIGRCVVWIDEIEKALAGATDGSADGGVSSDALGSFLSWMQERRGEAFVLATANDVSKLPPELLRKGRFDEIWWIDLPTLSERVDIIKAALKAHGRGDLQVDHKAIAEACDGFIGAEVASLVPEAMFVAFADGARELTTRDLLDAARTVTPLTETAGAKIEALREWAKGKARPASKADTRYTTDTPSRRRMGRAVDL